MGGALEALARADGAPASATFHVSGRGKDSWTGTLPEPNAAGTDGPFATPMRARDAARRLRAADKAGAPRRGDILILVHAGRHELAEPLLLAPEDSGTAGSRTVFAAAPGDEGRAVLSGGRVVSGWSAARGPRGEWVAPLPGLKDGWRFRHVSVDGRWRRPHPAPRRGDLHVHHGRARRRRRERRLRHPRRPLRIRRPARSTRAGRGSATWRSSSPTSGSIPT